MNLNCSYIELTKEMIDMKKLIKNKKGFTLIELIVVIAILAVLAAILIPSIMNYVAEAQKASNNSSARALYSEVAAKVAFGTLTADGKATGGGVSCDYKVTAGALVSFGPCTAVKGTVTESFAQATFSP